MWLSGHKQVQYFTDSQVARWRSRRPINGEGRGESPPRQDLPIAIEIGSPQVHVVRNISPGLRGPNISCKSSCCPISFDKFTSPATYLHKYSLFTLLATCILKFILSASSHRPLNVSTSIAVHVVSNVSPRVRLVHAVRNIAPLHIVQFTKAVFKFHCSHQF